MLIIYLYFWVLKFLCLLFLGNKIVKIFVESIKSKKIILPSLNLLDFVVLLNIGLAGTSLFEINIDTNLYSVFKKIVGIEDIIILDQVILITGIITVFLPVYGLLWYRKFKQKISFEYRLTWKHFIVFVIFIVGLLNLFFVDSLVNYAEYGDPQRVSDRIKNIEMSKRCIIYTNTSYRERLVGNYTESVETYKKIQSNPKIIELEQQKLNEATTKLQLAKNNPNYQDEETESCKKSEMERLNKINSKYYIQNKEYEKLFPQ